VYLSGSVTEAERILRNAVATSPVYADAFTYLADAAERAGHDVVARDALMNVDVLEGDTAPASVRLPRTRRIGELSLRAGEPKVALAYLTRVLSASPDDAQVLGLVAESQWRLGQDNDARDTLARALALAPQDAKLQRLAKLIR
jgi:predicted Zn-dependent protease